jgi:hypothetical protein
MVTAMVFGGIAWSLHERHGGWSLKSAGVGAYALFVYLVMSVLALYFRRWAWQAAVGIFGANLVVAAFSLTSLLGWVLLLTAAVGLWASFSRGTRAALLPIANEAA